jgi:uncharacterized membrane protein
LYRQPAIKELHMSSYAVGLFVPLGFFAMVCFVVYVIVEWRRRREQQRVELHSKLLDRIGSAHEFGEFLATEAGERFLSGISSERPHERIISTVRGGIVFGVLGITLLVAAYVGALGDEREDLLIVAIILFGLGAGLLLAGGASYAIARRFGVMGRDRDKDSPVV